MNLMPVYKRPYAHISRTSLIIMALFAFCSQISAQTTQKMYYGYLRDSAMGTAIAEATVTNQQTKVRVETDKMGFFAIPVNKGDLLLFSASGYGADSLRYFPYLPDTTHIELPRFVFTIEGVKVKTTTTMSKYQQDSTVRRDKFLADVGYKDKTFTKANSGAGLGINLKWGKKDKLRKEAYDHFDYQEEQYYIESRFSSDMVAYYTRLKGDSLNMFMGNYKPTYEWLRKNPSQQDIIYYLNDKLKEFYNRKEQ